MLKNQNEVINLNSYETLEEFCKDKKEPLTLALKYSVQSQASKNLFLEYFIV